MGRKAHALFPLNAVGCARVISPGAREWYSLRLWALELVSVNAPLFLEAARGSQEGASGIRFRVDGLEFRLPGRASFSKLLDREALSFLIGLFLARFCLLEPNLDFFFRLLAFDLAEKLCTFGFVDGEDDASVGAGDVGMGFLLFPLNRHDLEKPRRKKRSAPFCPLRKKRRKSWEIGGGPSKKKRPPRGGPS